MANKKISALTSATTPLAGTEILPIVQSSATVKVAVSDLTAGRVVLASGLGVNNNSPADYIEVTGSGANGIRVSRSGALTQYITLSSGSTGPSIDGASGIGEVSIGVNGSRKLVVANSGDVTLNTGNLVQGTAAKGVNFTANTPAAGMTSQLLNWYEEGTFTPTIVGTTTAGIGVYTSQTGRYTRTGNRVYINLYLAWSAHTGTGNMRIDGLPFTSKNVAGTYSALSPYISALTLTAGYWLQPYIGANRTFISLEQVQASAASIAVPMDISAEIIISGFYEV